MIDKDKIKIMTRMAVYDERHGEADRRINEYFRHDYVYRKNSWTRFYVFLGGCMLLSLYWLQKWAEEGIDIFTLDYKRELLDAGVFLGILMLIYTLISSQLGLLEYNRAQKRLEKYFALADILENPGAESFELPEQAKRGLFSRLKSRLSKGGGPDEYDKEYYNEEYEDDLDTIPANEPYVTYTGRGNRRRAGADKEEPFNETNHYNERDPY